MTHNKFLLLASFILASFYNLTFFDKVTEVYPVHDYFFFLSSLFVILVCALYIFLNLVCVGKLTKLMLSLNFFVATLIFYVSDSFGVVVDETMFLNIFSTDSREVLDLWNARVFIFLFVGTVLPSLAIFKAKILKTSNSSIWFYKIKSILISLIVVVVAVATNGKAYASFLREHKQLRYYTNPLYAYYSAYKFTKNRFEGTHKKLIEVGEDARIPDSDTERELIIFVVGETARADHFSLNGYAKETNPLLAKENVVSFAHVLSCGTSTAISVPCMFSDKTRNSFSEAEQENTENVLDVLKHTKKVRVLWRDNNSNSKGVADRVAYEDFRSPKKNHECDKECRDVGMLEGLQEYIDETKTGDIFIVLHQMGSHGPSYFRRYPEKFKKFKPTCETSELENCSNEEIRNTYDNTILYTDYFLSKVINFLKKNSDKFETAMFYSSDHGESLGEKGLYLHGFPYFMAPEEQIHPGIIVWLGKRMLAEIDLNKVRLESNNEISHDFIFHSLLGLFEVETKIYDSKLDIFSSAKKSKF
ncbi:MAG: phosphoethanolamine--lipid A transferase [Halobacteriovoraceae bacterium]|nr:phosphoethanolamine--lipid A transferase [Halobacteriovoraceae bacterium]